MKRFKITIYPVTPWSVEVQAENEEEAKKYALDLDGPSCYEYHGDNTDEWEHDILEWPNIGNGQVDAEHLYDIDEN